MTVREPTAIDSEALCMPLWELPEPKTLWERVTHSIQLIFYGIVARLVYFLRYYDWRQTANVVATLLAETRSALFAGYWSLSGHEKTFQYYGLNPTILTAEEKEMPVILLLHGKGSNQSVWVELAKTFQKERVPNVFTLNSQAGELTDEDIPLFEAKLEEIRRLFDGKTPEVIVIGHSRGAEFSLYRQMISKVKRAVFSLAFFTTILIAPQGFGGVQEIFGGSLFIGDGSSEVEGCALVGPYSLNHIDVKEDELCSFLALIEKWRLASDAILEEWNESLLSLKGILTYENIFDRTKLIQSNMIVKELLEKLDLCKIRYSQAFDELESATKSMKFEDYQIKLGGLMGITALKIARYKPTKEYFEVERAALGLYKQAVGFFLAVNGFFQISDDGELFFYREADEEEYNMLLGAFDKVEKEEMQMVQRMNKLRRNN